MVDPRSINGLREKLPEIPHELLPKASFGSSEANRWADLFSAHVELPDETREMVERQPDTLDGDLEVLDGVWGPGYETKDSRISREAEVPLSHGPLRKELNFRWSKLIRFFEGEAMPEQLLQFWSGGIQALLEWRVISRMDACFLRDLVENR